MQYRVRALWDHCLPVIINGIEIRRVVILVRVLTIKHHLHDFFFSHKHITSLPPPLHTVFVCDLASGWVGSSGKQNKAIWFLRPYTALRCPTLPPH